MPPRRTALAYLALSFALVGFACREERSSATGHRFDAVSSAAVRRPERSLYAPRALEEALNRIQKRVGNAASVLALDVASDRLTIQVESPARSGRVIQYEWFQGNLRGPIPVELRGSGALRNNLFPLSSVDLGKIPELTQAALDRIDRDHGQVKRIVVRRNLPTDEAVGIRVYVESPIRNSHVDADAHGRISEFPRIP